MNKIYDIIYHLSDSDFDGYSSQYLMSLTDENIHFFNSRIIDFKEQVKLIKQDILQQKGKKVLFLITDISLTIDEINKFNNFKASNKHIDINFQLLDHHIVSEEVSSTEWYHCNINKCSAKLTSDYVLENYSFDNKTTEYISYLGDFVDSVDRWIEDSIWFRKANLVSSYIYNKFFFFEEIKTYKRETLFWFIEHLTKDIKDKTIFEFEMKEPLVRLKFLKNKIPEDLFKDENVEIKDKFIEYYTILYKNSITPTYEIEINSKKHTFKYFYNLNSDIYQNLSHSYLKMDKKVDFMINIKSSGAMSFRSIHTNVQEIAFQYFEGGGHKLASGGRFKFQDKPPRNKEEFEKEILRFDFINVKQENTFL